MSYTNLSRVVSDVAEALGWKHNETTREISATCIQRTSYLQVRDGMYWYLTDLEEAAKWAEEWEKTSPGPFDRPYDSFCGNVEVVDPATLAFEDPEEWVGLCGVGGNIDARVGDDHE